MKKTTLVTLLALVFLALGLGSAYSQTTSTVPPDFEGTWQKSNTSRWLTFTSTTMVESARYESGKEETFNWTLKSVSGDTYVYQGGRYNGEKKINIKLEKGNLVIKGKMGDDWNATWKKTAQQATQQAQTNTAQQPQSLTPQPVKDEDFDVKQNKDNTITITGYKGTAKNIIIPETIFGLKVTSIGNFAFSNKGLTSVVIPDTVITIEDGETNHGTGVFSHNTQLIKVTFGKGLKTIGHHAFYETGLIEITFPDSVTNIGWASFADCKLTKVNFGTGLQTIEAGVFSDNQIEELNLPSSLKTIGGYAFAKNRIKKITFGTGLQTIEAGVFSDNQIEELNFPSSLKTIKGEAFADNKIQSVIIPNGVTISNIIYSGDDGSIRKGAFQNNPLTTVVIPASLAKGGIDTGRGRYDSAEEVLPFGTTNGSTITRITIPAGMDEKTLKAIFEEAFYNFWINQNRAGGTYVKRGPIWTKE